MRRKNFVDDANDVSLSFYTRRFNYLAIDASCRGKTLCECSTSLNG